MDGLSFPGGPPQVRSLTTRFALLLAAVAVFPLLAYGAVSILSMRQSTEDAVVQGDLDTAARVGEQIQQYVDGSVTILDALSAQAVRILKPGGRVLVMTPLPAEGLAALLGGHKGPAFDPEPALKAGGCKFVRVLGEKEGLRFVEGMKAR